MAGMTRIMSGDSEILYGEDKEDCEDLLGGFLDIIGGHAASYLGPRPRYCLAKRLKQNGMSIGNASGPALYLFGSNYMLQIPNYCTHDVT